MKKISLIALILLITPLSLFAQDIDPLASYSQYLRGVPTAQLSIQPNEHSGAYQHSYTFKLPPGRNGMTPELSLSYSSQRQNNININGFGWDLSIPSIQRFNKEGVENLYTLPNFKSSLSGELLTISESNQFGLYGPRVEDGSFLKYEYRSDNSWTMTTKVGKIYTFGATPSDRQDNPNDSSQVYTWMLSSIEDRNGNRIDYSYLKEGNLLYPSEITYTNTEGASGIFSTQFEYEDQTPYTQWSTAFEVVTNKRISAVKAYVNNSVVRAYDFTYSYSVENGRSLLISLQETGYENGSSIVLPKTIFEYSDSNMDWVKDETWSANLGLSFTAYGAPSGWPNKYGFDAGVRMVDMSGDGIPDILKGGGFQGSRGGVQYWTSGKYITNPLTKSWTNAEALITTQPTFVKEYGETNHNLSGDFDGDGFIDFHYNSGIYWNNGDGTFTSTDIPANASADIDNDRGWYYLTGVRVADVNGDGLDDIIRSGRDHLEKDGVYLALPNRQGFYKDTDWQLPGRFFGLVSANGSAEFSAIFTDLNHDGLADVIGASRPDSPPSILINRGDKTWTSDTSYEFPQLLLWDTSFYTVFWDLGHRFVDMNGDGIFDLVHGRQNAGSSAPDTGSTVKTMKLLSSDVGISGSFPRSTTRNVCGNCTIMRDQGVRFADLNGDGMTDVLKASYDTPNEVYINTGQKPDLLTQISTPIGGTVNITYTQSGKLLNAANTAHSNPDLPFSISLVESIAKTDDFGTQSLTSYDYEGGLYNVYDSYEKEFAGFAVTKQTDSVGNEIKTYFHQGNVSNSTQGEYSDQRSKVGKVYRTEIYDSSDNLYNKIITKWVSIPIGITRDYVYQNQVVTQMYDGNSTHKDTANLFTYDGFGNILTQINFGEVTTNNDGSFSDIGNDKQTETASYTNNVTDYIVGLPKTNNLKNYSNITVSQTRTYYDNLPLGSVFKGNITKEDKLKGGGVYVSTERTYNSYGLPVSETDPNGNTTTYIYDSYNLYPISSVNAVGHVTQNTYDYSSGKIVNSINPNSYKTTITYDGLDRPIIEKIPNHLGSPSTQVTKTTWNYNDARGTKSVRQTNYLDSANGVDVYTYLDGFDRVIQTRTEAESSNTYTVASTEYDKRGNVKTKTLPYFETGYARTGITSNGNLKISNTYDTLNRLTRTTDTLGSVTHTYDNWNEIITDKLGNQKIFTSDAFGNLIQVQERNNDGTYITNYNYDVLGNLIKIIDALGNIRHFTFDKLSRLTVNEDLHTVGDNAFGTQTFIYDNAGNILSKTDANNQTMTYTYDTINRLLTEDYTGNTGTEIAYVYDTCLNGVGLLCTAATNDVTTSLTYDALGNVGEETRIIDGDTFVTGSTLDRQGNLTQLIYPNLMQVDYIYNNAGLAESIVVDSQPLVTNFDYSPTGAVTTKDLSNGLSTINTYDATALYRLQNIHTASSTVGQGGSMESMYLDDYLSLTELSQFTMAKGKFVNDFGELNDGLKRYKNEDKSKRTKNSKTFTLGGSKYKSQFYSGDIHYQNNQTNQFEDIDIRLIDEGDSWNMSKARYKVKLSKGNIESIIKYSIDGVKLSITPIGSTKKLFGERSQRKEKKGRGVEYIDALGDGVNLEVETLNTGIRKDAVIDSWKNIKSKKNDYLELPFKLTSSVELDLYVDGKKLTAQKPIRTSSLAEIRSEEGVISYIWGPVAVDAGDDVTQIEIEYAKKGKNIILTKYIPMEFLKNATYPVRADATIGYTPPTGDGYISRNGVEGESWDSIHDSNFGGPFSTEAIYVSSSQDSNGSGRYRISRGHIPFDTSSIDDAATIQSATLSVEAMPVAPGGAELIGLVSNVRVANINNLVSQDYDQIGDSINNPTEGVVARVNLSDPGIKIFTLNSAGISWISKTGMTALGLRHGNDIEDIVPTTDHYSKIASFEKAATNQPPLLTVEYTLTSNPEIITLPVDQTSVDTINLKGTLTNLAGLSSLDVQFVYGGTRVASATTSPQTISSETKFSDLITNLSTNTEYWYKAFAKTSAGNIYYGDTHKFFTADISTAVPIGVEENHAWGVTSFDDGSHSGTTNFQNSLQLESSGSETLVDDQTFESTYELGKWKNLSTDTCDWKRDSGGTPSSNTGPTSGKNGSYYAYVETSSGYCYRSSNTAVIEYNTDNTAEGTVDFNYNMYGSNMGTLRVDAYNGSSWNTIWSLSGNQGTAWSVIQSANFNEGTTKLRLHYTAAGSWRGDAAIDIVEVIHTGVTSDSESFEGIQTLGNWSNTTTDTCSWLRDSAGTPSSNTGPSTGKNGSYYLYVETSSGACYHSGDTASVEYDVVTAGNGRIEFNYNMYGSNVGTLKVDAFDGSSWITVWTLTGNQGSSWSSMQDVAFPNGTTKLRFHYTAAGSYRGDVAIDDIRVYGQSEEYSSGEWLSTAWDIGSITSAGSSYVEIDINSPSDAHVTLSAALSTNSSMPPVESAFVMLQNQQPLPGISQGDDLSGKYLWVKAKLESSSDRVQTPTLKKYVLAINDSSSGGTIDELGKAYQSISYEYDAQGNITKITDNSSGGVANETIYTYDDLYRLTSAETLSASSSPYTRMYSYNAIGNIINKSDLGAYSYSNTGYANPHAVTDLAGTIYSYDNNGNVTTAGDWNYLWNYRDRLMQSSNGASTTDYVYDHNNMRVKRAENGETILYPNQYFNVSGTDTTSHVLDSGGKFLATIKTIDGTINTYFMLADHLGSTHLMADERGNTTEVNSYYPFGEERITENTKVDNEQLKFTGHEYDVDSDLTYAKARYYNQDVGKFLSIDPAALNVATGEKKRKLQILSDPQLQNTYAYGRNNPIILTDPNGELPILIAPLIIYSPQIIAVGTAITGSAFLSSMLADDVATLTDSNASLGTKGLIVGGSLFGGAGKGARFGLNTGDKLLNTTASQIRLSENKLNHINARHTMDGELIDKTSGVFAHNVSVESAVFGAEGKQMIMQKNKNIRISYNAGVEMGLDINTGRSTPMVTVITRQNGDVVTAYPGSGVKR